MTNGNWSVGRHGCVVSDTVASTEDQRTGHGDSKYYGGVLICESIRTPEDAKLIASAPTMLKMLIQVKCALEGSDNIDANGSITQIFGQFFYNELVKTINKAKP